MANLSSTLPFGTLDTPGPGETVGNGIYTNYGWVLARAPRRADVPGGGSVRVYIDGVIAAAAKPGAMTPRQAGALTSDPGALRAFKDIATLRDADVPRPADAPTDGAAAAAAARARGMNRLAERLESPG